MHGYFGCYLRVDLSTGISSKVSIPDSVYQLLIGGLGLGCYILQRESPENVDPLSPEAPLVFSFSPLVGSPITTSAKFVVLCKSPLTNLLNDSLASSQFALDAKAMGVDALVFVGKAKKQSYWDCGELKECRLDSGSLWGLSAAEAEQKLKRPKTSVIAIGLAGENLVPFAALSHDGRHAGRGGAGAVLGSKNLKAILVSGDQTCSFADSSGLLQQAKKLAKKSQGVETRKYRELGTANNLENFHRLGLLPTRNFQESAFEAVLSWPVGRSKPKQDVPSGLDSATKTQAYRKSCARCTIACEHGLLKGDGKRIRVEYESLFALGSLCCIEDFDRVLEASELCDNYGLDSISTGVTIAFAMECKERGFFEAAPSFGDSADLITCIHEIAANKSERGRLLALGTRRLAAHLGNNSLDFAAQVKGLELPGYDPRSLQHMAIAFAVCSRGADHNKSSAYELDFSSQHDRAHPGSQAASALKRKENESICLDSLILCKFVRGALGNIEEVASDLLKAVTGCSYGAPALQKSISAIADLKKIYNESQGWSPILDQLPKRFLASSSSRPGLCADSLQALVQSYNLERNWTPAGHIPSPRKSELLAQLGL